MYDESDFIVFEDQTLVGRLGKIKQFIDPKFEVTAEKLQRLFKQHGLVVYGHVAKHVRRTTNPPVDTWIAFGPNKRGYKKDPHFELGFWDDRMFIKLCLLNESKVNLWNTKFLNDSLNNIYKLDSKYGVNGDHTKKGMRVLDSSTDLIERYGKVKSAEFMVGIEWKRNDKFFVQANQHQQIENVFADLIEIYKIWVQ